MLESGSRSNIHEALANYRSGAEMSAPTSRRQTGDGDRPKIHPMPPNPLSLLTKLTAFIKVWVMSPWLACVQHPTALRNPKMSNLIQKCHPYTGNLTGEMSGDSKDVFLHCGDVLAQRVTEQGANHAGQGLLACQCVSLKTLISMICLSLLCMLY